MSHSGRPTLCSVYAKWLAFDSIFTKLTPFKIFTAHLYLRMVFSTRVVWLYSLPCSTSCVVVLSTLLHFMCGRTLYPAPLHVWLYSLPCSTSCVVLHNVLLHFMCGPALYLYFMCGPNSLPPLHVWSCSTVGSSQSPVVIDLTLSSDEEEDEPSRPR